MYGDIPETRNVREMWRDINNDRSNVLFDGRVDIVATFRKNDNEECRGFLDAFHDLPSGVVQLISYVPLAALVEHVVGGRDLDALVSRSGRASSLKEGREDTHRHRDRTEQGLGSCS